MEKMKGPEGPSGILFGWREFRVEFANQIAKFLAVCGSARFHFRHCDVGEKLLNGFDVGHFRHFQIPHQARLFGRPPTTVI